MWPGPVIDGSVVDQVSAAALIRCTALNVSREIRAEVSWCGWFNVDTCCDAFSHKIRLFDHDVTHTQASLAPHHQTRQEYLQRIIALKFVSRFEDDMGSLLDERCRPATRARTSTTTSKTTAAS